VNGFLLDTNIPSEMTRPRPQVRVTGWLEDIDDNHLYFSVVSLGEILKGLTVLPAGQRRSELQQWLDGVLRPWFQGRILPVSEAIAERWGILAGESRLMGRPLQVADGLIAATALEHNLTLVTRNVKDFAGIGVTVFNPWDAV
jgi:toxin FitB